MDEREIEYAIAMLEQIVSNGQIVLTQPPAAQARYIREAIWAAQEAIGCLEAVIVK